jgi:hypothetical protein
LKLKPPGTKPIGAENISTPSIYIIAQRDTMIGPELLGGERNLELGLIFNL